MVSRNGSEQRASIQATPRARVEMRYPVFSQRDRTITLSEAQELMDQYSLIPMFQYSTQFLASALQGSDTLVFDTEICCIDQGVKIVILDSSFKIIGEAEVENFTGNTVTVDEVPVNVGTTNFVCPKFSGYVTSLKDNFNGIFGSQTTEVFIPTDYILENQSSISITQFSSLNVQTVRPNRVENSSVYITDPVDFEYGRVDLFSPRDQFTQETNLTFLIRQRDFESLKYWKKFFNTVRGSWLSFLMPTFLNDVNASSLTQNGSTIVFPSENYFSIPELSQTFRRIEIEYSDGTVSRHTITEVTSVSPGNTTFTITPNLPNDPKVENFRRISRLLRIHMSDTIQLTHTDSGIEISFSVQSVKE